MNVNEIKRNTIRDYLRLSFVIPLRSCLYTMKVLVLLTLFIFLVPTNSYETCQTPNQKPGKCVLINHCPHLLSALLQNQTNKDLVRQSHCGFHSTFFPKVCCPLEAVNLHTSKHPPKCGFHTPDGDADPWLALIEYEKLGGERAFLCGGVLIHKKYVLTAAHCIAGRSLPKTAKMVSVHFGGGNLNNSLSVQVEESVVHENYDPNDPNQSNDIALVRLKKKVLFGNGSIMPICLPGGGSSTIGAVLQVAGWEKTKNSSNNYLKRAGIATIWDNSECDSVYNTTGIKLKESQICVGGKRRVYGNSHPVDVRGVLMNVSSDTIYSIVGIMSLEPPCCDKENYPKVYTKISSYINWIFINMDV